MIFAKFFGRRSNPAQPLYEAIVAAARQPHFYKDDAVPDTVDGRFDVLLLHLSLVIEKLRPAQPEFSQRLVDYFCMDMDDNLRELGAGDLSVGKKVRRMAEAFQGRYQVYGAARDMPAMAAAVERNVFAGAPAAGAQAIARFALTAREALAEQDANKIAAGTVAFS